MRMEHRAAVGLALIVVAASACAATAQPAASASIEWEVANRFRLFTHQRDFDEHVKAALAQDGKIKSIFATEQTLSGAADRNGWAAALVSRLCYDTVRGRIIDRCIRDDVEENYLNPKTHRIRLSVLLPPQFVGARCTWTIGSGAAAKIIETDCGAAIDDQRVPNNAPTTVRVVARNQAGQSTDATATIQVRDLLIVGIGDSIASGEGNPVVPVDLSPTAFCFRRVLTGGEFFLPGRTKADVHPNCPAPGERFDELDTWNAVGAGWLFNACHRSIYGYQTRVALALAIENKNVSVTYLPLGCTGATIKAGILGSQEARERPKQGQKQGPRDVEAQISQLRNYLKKKNTNVLFRTPDLILLTVGANDIGFAGLVANVIVAENPERFILKSEIVTPDAARAQMNRSLAQDFGRLRKALAPFTNNSLKRVVFAPYGNPGTSNGGSPCATTRRGFDAHPAFTLDGAGIATTVSFVETEFIPRLKSLSTCGSPGVCTDPARQSMVYVEGHRAAFADHGFCALDDEPEFDRDCFRNGNSFRAPTQGNENPLACRRNPNEFRPYAKRSRWIRTVNDSFFAAMTYPSKGGADPSDIHDGRWGLTSVVYGGAIHPTAEGHAAMADAAVAAARTALGLPSPPQ